MRRDYADLYASRHGRIPPLIAWFLKPHADTVVESLRRQHRNLWLLSGALVAGAGLVALYIRATTPG